MNGKNERVHPLKSMIDIHGVHIYQCWSEVYDYMVYTYTYL